MMVRRSWHGCQPVDLHSLARQWFVGNRRIELQKLAVELGISRATAYRWAGSAEQLIGKVLASLLDDTFQRLARQTTTTGSQRVLEVFQGVMRASVSFLPLRKFLEKDAHLGLKIAASRSSPVRERTIANLQQLIEEEAQRGHLTIAEEKPEKLAHALTRIMESFLYTDLIVGDRPDFEEASEMLELILRQD